MAKTDAAPQSPLLHSVLVFARLPASSPSCLYNRPMKRVILPSSSLSPRSSRCPAAQMRVVPLDDEQGHVALGLALRHLAQHRHLHAHDRASRRREQRAAGDAQPRPGLSHGAGDRDARQRRPERDRAGDLRGARRAADRRARGAAPLRRRRAVLHARGRLRLLVQHRRDVREVGARGDHRRLRAADPDDPSRRHHHAAATATPAASTTWRPR